MRDEPVVTAYPHDRLSRLADAMAGALVKIPGTGDVRAVIILNDAQDGCLAPHGYPEGDIACNSLLLVNVAVHLMQAGRALGMNVEVTVDGKKVPPPGGPRG